MYTVTCKVVPPRSGCTGVPAGVCTPCAIGLAGVESIRHRADRRIPRSASYFIRPQTSLPDYRTAYCTVASLSQTLTRLSADGAHPPRRCRRVWVDSRPPDRRPASLCLSARHGLLAGATLALAAAARSELRRTLRLPQSSAPRRDSVTGVA